MSTAATNDILTLALSKGRILDDTLPLLAAAGIEPEESPHKSRKLIFQTTRPDVRLLVIRAADVPTYVRYGGADAGIAGKDVLMEDGAAGLYEPLDLGIAQCRLSVCGKPDTDLNSRRLRVATKYVDLARKHFAARGRQADIIKLYGSMELAPLIDMADLIVDLVDTGNTLKANGLVEMEQIAEISSRLVVNRASMKLKHVALRGLIDELATAVQANTQAKSV